MGFRAADFNNPFGLPHRVIDKIVRLRIEGRELVEAARRQIERAVRIKIDILGTMRHTVRAEHFSKLAFGIDNDDAPPRQQSQIDRQKPPRFTGPVVADPHHMAITRVAVNVADGRRPFGIVHAIAEIKPAVCVPDGRHGGAHSRDLPPRSCPSAMACSVSACCCAHASFFAALPAGISALVSRASCWSIHLWTARTSMKAIRSLTQSSGSVAGASSPSWVVERITPLPASGWCPSFSMKKCCGLLSRPSSLT